MIVVKHEGVDIQYDEFNNRWKVDDEKQGITLVRQSLEDAKKGVNQALKSKGMGRFARFNAWSRGRWGSSCYELVTVTSIVDTSVGVRACVRLEAWITYPKKTKTSKAEREKALISSLYKDTARNRQRIEKINELRMQVAKLSDKAMVIEENLDVITVKKEKKDDD